VCDSFKETKEDSCRCPERQHGSLSRLESRVLPERRNFTAIPNGAAEKPACVTLNQAIPRLAPSFRVLFPVMLAELVTARE